ncbi:hypothetical protein DPMN_099051 [Dreissena polymorpha]|uniref:Uncharacterized protein n=1 Tax=Dreissena polymorpha TaxID=45954 RepID=A0A9D4LDF9_DREPO|nr:hypothetical protein DPMN_099051 [Dreissena polymorpha]
MGHLDVTLEIQKIFMKETPIDKSKPSNQKQKDSLLQRLVQSRMLSEKHKLTLASLLLPALAVLKSCCPFCTLTMEALILEFWDRLKPSGIVQTNIAE